MGKKFTKKKVIDGKKVCSDCHTLLPLSAYYKGDCAGGRKGKCKKCSKAYGREYRQRLKTLEKKVPEEKTCYWCKGTFGPEAFNKNATKPDGLQTACADCEGIMSRYHYYRPKPQRVTWDDVLAKKDRLNQFQPSLDT